MACTCPDNTYIQSTVNGVVICTKTTTIPNISCPPGCTLIIQPNGNAVCSCIDIIPPTITQEKPPIYFDNAMYFEDVSWTIAYKPMEGSWVSHYSFKPNYYVSHNNYFQTGLNYYKNGYRETLNNHLLTNKSYKVFYGERFPMIIEVPIKSDYVTKTLESIKLNVEAKRFQNEYDFAVNNDLGFDSAIIYNSTNNSGLLRLKLQKNSNDIRNYPKTSEDKKEQEILYNSFEGKHSFNYFYNRVRNEDSNVEQWVNDKSYVDKQINSNAVNFKGDVRLDRIRGEYFILRLINEKDSQHQIMLKNVISDEKIG